MKKLRILFVPVGLPAEVREIEHSVEAMQAAVGGYFELLSLPDGVDLWCNEDAIGLELPFNRHVADRVDPGVLDEADFVIRLEPEPGHRYAEPGETGVHRIHGDFFLANRAGDEAADITDDQIAAWLPRLNRRWL